MSERIERAASAWLSDISHFSRLVIKKPLRAYQVAPLRAVIGSVMAGAGREFLMVFPRQSGKNEAAAQLLVYLLNVFQEAGGQIVYTAQADTLNVGITRLEARLENEWNRLQWRKGAGPRRCSLGRASVLFLSSYPCARVRGNTAHILLVVDEAQEQAASQIEAVFTPMRAATNATALYIGTVRTASDYLWAKKRELEAAQAQDHTQRVWLVHPETVCAEVPAYRRFLERQVSTHGRHHPTVASEYFLEPVDGRSGLFPPRRRWLMRGRHSRQAGPLPGRVYVATLDVAGEDEASTDPLAGLANPGRDYTVATVFEVCFPGVGDGAGPAVGEPGASDRWSAAAWWAGPILGAESGPGWDARGAAGWQSGPEWGVEGMDEAGGLNRRVRSPGGTQERDVAAGPERPVAVESQAAALGLPVYRAVDVFVDHGSKHFGGGAPALSQRLLAWLERWQVAHLVADASGVGRGLASWLQAALGEGRVSGYDFSGRGAKAALGTAFLALVETGRFQYWADEGALLADLPATAAGGSPDPDALATWRGPGDPGRADGRAMPAEVPLSHAWWFWRQVEACGYELPPGGVLEKDLRWGVPAGHRTDTPAGSKPTHDDRLLSAALVAELDRLVRMGKVGLGLAQSSVIAGLDPLGGDVY